jgi:hypothetical protein
MGNIPVKNGVVHLIHRPLMVVDTTVAKFLEVCNDVALLLLYFFGKKNFYENFYFTYRSRF